MTKKIYIIEHTTYSNSKELGTAVSSEAYESVEDAKQFIAGRSGYINRSENDGWVVEKREDKATLPYNDNPYITHHIYKIREITIKEAK